MFNFRVILIVTLWLVSFTLVAEESAASKITAGQPIYSSSPTVNKRSEQSKYCDDLYKKAQALKGKPQRYYAATWQYKTECVSDR